MTNKLSILLPALLAVAACAPSIGSNDYGYSSVGQASSAFPCTVLSVRSVNVNSSGGTGTVIGGLAGGVRDSNPRYPLEVYTISNRAP